MATKQQVYKYTLKITGSAFTKVIKLWHRSLCYYLATITAQQTDTILVPYLQQLQQYHCSWFQRVSQSKLPIEGALYP